MRAYIIKEKPAANLRVSAPEDVSKFMNTESQLDREVFWVVPLNVKNLVVGGIIPVEIGGVAECLVHPKIIFRELIVRQGVVAFVLVHNHPSGDTSPSEEDKDVSSILKRGGDILGIKLLDSVIISHGAYCSLREQGYFN